VKKILSELQIEQSNSFAFGDQINDLEMLKYVGTGIAMGNATDSVKEIADFITKDTTNFGIEHGLTYFSLITE